MCKKCIMWTKDNNFDNMNILLKERWVYVMVKKQRTLKPKGESNKMMGLHEEHSNLKAFTADQQSIRSSLMFIMSNHPKSLRQFADEIGIGYGTLHNFLSSGKRVNYVSLLKISAFLLRHEKEKSKSVPKQIDKHQEN